MRRAPSRASRVAAAVASAAVAAALLVGCVGRAGGNDSDKQPGEPNPARQQEWEG